jgi:hypothetical protein
MRTDKPVQLIRRCATGSGATTHKSLDNLETEDGFQGPVSLVFLASPKAGVMQW